MRDISIHPMLLCEDKVMEMIPQSQNGNLVTQTSLINESGLYSLILSSKLPSAKKFKKWVTSEVLPDIRKQGMYMTPETLLNDPDVIIQMTTAYKEEKAEVAIRDGSQNRNMTIINKPGLYSLILSSKHLVKRKLNSITNRYPI